MHVADRHRDTKILAVNGTPFALRAGELSTRRLVIAWAISAPELAPRLPAASRGPVCLEIAVEAADGEPVAGALRVETVRAVVSARLVAQDGASATIDPPLVPCERNAAATWTFDAESGLEHIDVPGVLNATLRVDAKERGGDADVRLLYARTPLFESLGIPGGRCDLPAVSPRNAIGT